MYTSNFRRNSGKAMSGETSMSSLGSWSSSGPFCTKRRHGPLEMVSSLMLLPTIDPRQQKHVMSSIAILAITINWRTGNGERDYDDGGGAFFASSSTSFAFFFSPVHSDLYPSTTQFMRRFLPEFSLILPQTIAFCLSTNDSYKHKQRPTLNFA